MFVTFVFAFSKNSQPLMTFDETGTHVSLFPGSPAFDISYTANDGMWHFVCFLADSLSGTWKMFLDGTVVSSGSGYGNGKKISGRYVFCIWTSFLPK